jgi:cytochrome d ubiquinol oxidase subunit I
MTIREERDNADPAETRRFEAHSADLGFAFLLKKYVDDPRRRRPSRSRRPPKDTIPTVWPLFWAFRIMVALGFGFIGMMAYFFYRASFRA